MIVNQSSNQSSNQSMDQSINQANERSRDQTIDLSINQWPELPVDPFREDIRFKPTNILCTIQNLTVQITDFNPVMIY